MLIFSYDQTKLYKLKQSEIFFIDTIENTNTLVLKNLKQEDVGEVFLIKDQHVEGLPLTENEHYFFNSINTNQIILVDTPLLRQYTNFYIQVVSKEGMYLFEGQNEDQQLNTQIMGNDIEVVQRIYVFQTKKNYKNITITQKDLSSEYGLNQKNIKFQISDDETENQMSNLVWSDTLYIQNLFKDTYKTFYIKLIIPRTGISTFMRDVVLQYKQFEY